MSKCKYCSLSKYKGEYLLKETKEGRDEFTVYLFSAVLGGEKKYMLGVNHHRWNHDDVEIFYCPMCGRRLDGTSVQMSLEI